jgi:hypothetical protein
MLFEKRHVVKHDRRLIVGQSPRKYDKAKWQLFKHIS